VSGLLQPAAGAGGQVQWDLAVGGSVDIGKRVLLM